MHLPKATPYSWLTETSLYRKVGALGRIGRYHFRPKVCFVANRPDQKNLYVVDEWSLASTNEIANFSPI